MHPKLSRVSTLVAAGFIAAYFIYFATGSLLTEFTHDDLMNCYRGWFYPLPNLLADNLLFFRFSPMYRPFGALVYKAFFDLFGFDLFPLRAFLLLVLAANVFLVYKLCRVLTHSIEAGLFAALVHAYHMKLGPLYTNTGTLYDIFAFFFYFAAVVFYISIRQSGKNPTALHGLALLLLYVLALDSKELAASLPLALIAYELLWHPPLLEKRALVHWVTRQTWIIWVAAAMTIAYAKGRVLAEQGGITNVGHYAVTVSAAEYLTKLAYYLNELFYSPGWFDVPRAAIFVCLLLIVGAVSRSRGLLFGALLFLGGLLPMAFIDTRALSAIYVPLAGLSIFGGVLLGFVCGGLRRVSHKQAWQTAAFFAVFALAGLLLIRAHPDNLHIYVASSEHYRQIRNAREQLQQLHPRFPEGSRILILETPFPQYSPGYNNLFMIQLAYRDQSLLVEEMAMLEQSHEPVIPSNYDYLLSYKNERWYDVDPAALQAGLAADPAANSPEAIVETQQE